MLKKKGMQNIFMYLIIFLVVGVILLFFVRGVTKWMEGKNNVEVCRLSVIGASQLGKGTGFDYLAPEDWEFECPPNTVTIKEDVYESNGYEQQYRHGTWEDNVKQVFADEMATCWYKFGEGKLDAFDDDTIFGLTNVCFVCDYILFDAPPLTQVNNLKNFLETHSIPNTLVQKERITYWDYMNIYYDATLTDLIDKSHSSIILLEEGDIYTDWDYVIAFQVVGKKAKLPGNVGLEDTLQFIVVGTAEKVELNCDYYYE